MKLTIPKMPSKYHAKKVTLDGITFDSKKEASRYAELKILQKAGRISNLELQKEFELIPVQRDYITNKVIERPVKYIADFYYYDNTHNKYICEDVKSPYTKTRDYIIKRKLLLYTHNIRITEV